MRVILSSLAALALAAGVSAPSAHGHETGAHTGFVSTVSGIEPPLPGLLVQVAGGHERLAVRNFTQQTVVVFDEQGQEAARLDPGESDAWPDPRIDGLGPPPDRDGLVRNWRIAGEADGERFEIVGFLGYRAPPGELEGGGFPVWAAVLAAAAGALVVAAALALPLRRREGEGERAGSAPTEP